VLTAVAPDQLLVKIMNDELTALMGGTASDINLDGNPSVVLISGLQGSGKNDFLG
jgi:signal recognition particle subunit SRP54